MTPSGSLPVNQNIAGWKIHESPPFVDVFPIGNGWISIASHVRIPSWRVDAADTCERNLPGDLPI